MSYLEKNRGDIRFFLPGFYQVDILDCYRCLLSNSLNNSQLFFLVFRLISRVKVENFIFY